MLIKCPKVIFMLITFVGVQIYLLPNTDIKYS